MSDKLPDNVKRFDILKIEHGMQKLCTCGRDFKYKIDTENRLIYCKCGAIIDPFEAICNLAKHYDRISDETQRILQAKKEVAMWNPWLLPLREIERTYHGGSMLPSCPHCGRGILVDELARSSVNKGRELERRKFDKKEG